jgi:uncharacterized iron-regulated protein
MNPLSFLSSRLCAAQRTNAVLKATVSCLLYLSLMLVVSAQNLDGILRGLVVDAAGKEESHPSQADAQLTADNFRVYRSGGGLETLADIVKAMADYDVVLLGETHDDPVAHFLEAELLRLAYEHHTPRRPVALSLEMFERDVQTVVDEYLADQIQETHFLKSARPWRNYESDYKPMIKFAKARRLPVIAANAPRRYVNRVSRFGKASLDELSIQAKTWLPPLPYGDASPAYAEKFHLTMRSPRQSGDSASHQVDDAAARERAARSVAAQSLWDASMAHAIAGQLNQRKGALVLHVNGRFHSEERMGIPDHLERYRPGSRAMIVTMVPTMDFAEFKAESHAKYGDFVILTDGRLPRSFQAEESQRK